MLLAWHILGVQQVLLLFPLRFKFVISGFQFLNELITSCDIKLFCLSEPRFPLT